MVARWSALWAGLFLPPGRFLVLIFVRGWVKPKAIPWLEGLGKLKKSTSSGTRIGYLPASSIVPQPCNCVTFNNKTETEPRPAVKLLTWICITSGSHLSWGIDYCNEWFSWLSWVPPSKHSHPSQVIIHYHHHHQTISFCTVSISDSIVTQTPLHADLHR
jgi:hypothetical protein